MQKKYVCTNNFHQDLKLLLLAVHNMSENVVSSESGVKYAQIKHILQGSSKQMYQWILIWEDNRG